MGSLQRSAVQCREQSGVSLVEALIVVAIVATLVALAIPSFADMAARERMRGAADNLRGDLNLARYEAIKRKRYVYVVFSSGPQWCYAVTLDATCGCGIACADPDSLLKQATNSEAAKDVAMSASFAGSFCGATECVRFESFHGTAMGSDGHAYLTAADGSQYRVLVGSIGRARVCRYAGAGGSVPNC